MAKYCSDCTYFNPNDKKAPGYCKCSKIGKNVFGNQSRCEKFSEAYARGWYEKEKLYDDAIETQKKGSDSNIPFIFGILLFVFALIIFFFFT